MLLLCVERQVKTGKNRTTRTDREEPNPVYRHVREPGGHTTLKLALCFLSECFFLEVIRKAQFNNGGR
jgi:hypothetical protein